MRRFTKQAAQVGFTLIELLIVVTIVILIAGGGIASYVSFNERQELVNTGKQLQQMLHSAQKRVQAGETPGACDQLKAYLVIYDSIAVAFKLQAECVNNSYVIQTLRVPAGVTLTSPANLQMRYATLYGGVSNPGDVVLSSARSGRQYQFTVDKSGQISEGVIGSP